LFWLWCLWEIRINNRHFLRHRHGCIHPDPVKKKDDTVNGESNKTVIPTTESQPKAVQAVEDPSVIQSEINDMKQAVVSMSVGQPSTATKIVQDWIVTEAPAPLEPEVVQPEESSEEEDGGKKKKKKKKK
jgi:hypothetical protein